MLGDSLARPGMELERVSDHSRSRSYGMTELGPYGCTARVFISSVTPTMARFHIQTGLLPALPIPINRPLFLLSSVLTPRSLFHSLNSVMEYKPNTWHMVRRSKY